MRHAIFDLDGTLVDSVAVCTTIMNAMLVDRGCERLLSAAEARPHISLGGSDMIASCLGDFCDDAGEGIKEFRTRYVDMPTPADSLFSGVREGLTQLRDWGYSLSICSNKPQNLCEKVLGELELDQFFGTIVGGRPGVPSKPAPDLLHLALELSGQSPQDSCFIGDSEPDHLAAQRVGIPFLLVTYGYAEPDWNCDTVASCDSFHSVPDNIDAVLDLVRERRRAGSWS